MASSVTSFCLRYIFVLWGCLKSCVNINGKPFRTEQLINCIVEGSTSLKHELVAINWQHSMRRRIESFATTVYKNTISIVKYFGEFVATSCNFN